MAETNSPNPNGANQYQMDPRQKLCWESYINPRSETFGNGTQSAIKAGYEPDYADQITTIDWFKGKLRRLNMLSKAEKVLDETLDYDVNNGGDKLDAGIARIKLDAAKVIATTLGKDEGYATRSEVTGKDGAEIMGVVILPQKNGTKDTLETSTETEDSTI